MFWLLNFHDDWISLSSKSQLIDGLNVVGYGRNEYSVKYLLSIFMDNGEIDYIPSLVLSGIEVEKAVRLLTVFEWGVKVTPAEDDDEYFAEFCPDNGWRKLCLNFLLTRHSGTDLYRVSGYTDVSVKAFGRFEFNIRAVNNVVLEVFDFCIPNDVSWDSVAKVLDSFGWTYDVRNDEPVWFERINCVK